ALADSSSSTSCSCLRRAGSLSSGANKMTEGAGGVAVNVAEGVTGGTVEVSITAVGVGIGEG
ncbi:MAG: hypothetical protein ACWGO1_04995, partial [Anaerolineales bacterium]